MDTEGWDTLEEGPGPLRQLCGSFESLRASASPGEGRPGSGRGTLRRPSSGWGGSPKHCPKPFCPICPPHGAQGWPEKARPDLQLFASWNYANSYCGS